MSSLRTIYVGPTKNAPKNMDLLEFSFVATDSAPTGLYYISKNRVDGRVGVYPLEIVNAYVKLLLKDC